MAIVAADLIAWAAASMPDDDTSTAGGAIDLLRRIDFTQIAANDDIEVISTSASDTQNCTIEGRDATGAIVTETVALTGTTAKIFATLGVIERVLKVELASAAIGTITVRRSVAGATVGTIPIGERGFMMVFRKTKSDPSSGKTYYMKFFWKNTHATLSLLTATITQSADPSGKITHTGAAAVNDTNTVANRVTAPGASIIEPDTFADSAVSVPGTNLAAGVAIGVWLLLTLAAGDAPQKTTYTSALNGDSA